MISATLSAMERSSSTTRILAGTGVEPHSNSSSAALIRIIIRQRPRRVFLRSALLSRPTGAAFFQKCRDAFLGVGGQRIHAHHFFGIGIGFGLVEIDLGV